MTNDKEKSDCGYPLPSVLVRDGKIFANSRDVAAFFGKEHAHILRDIDNLLKNIEKPNLDSLFQEESYAVEGQCRAYRSVNMSRDGFTLLAMGFTGQRALAFKLRYIEAFNRMEEVLTDPIAVLNDPAAMRGLLLTYTEKVLALEERLEAAKPKIEGFDRLSTSEGSLCITDAAKLLQVRPKDLFGWMQSHGWIYHRPGKAGYLPYQDRIKQGVLAYKAATVECADGTEKIVEAVRVTSKGLTKLANNLSEELTS